MIVAGDRVAIVHERFTDVGGSEKVVEQLHHLWPGAVVHAPIVDVDAVPAGLADAELAPTWLQRLYRGGTGYSHLLPLLPVAMSGVEVGDVDLVVTSHHAFANRVRPPAGVPVLAYVHTPARWLWEARFRRYEVGAAPARAALAAFASTQRRADRAAAGRVDTIVANSRHVADRIRRHWGRDATVVAPPIDTDFFTPDPTVEREDFFLLAGRLVPYKAPQVAAAAARAAGVRLVVAGHGRSQDAVADAGGPAVELLGAVDDVTMRDLFRRCRALVFPGEEDFGMVPVEAMACGAPVIALGRGGALDSVVDGETGVLVASPDVGAFARALGSFRTGDFDSDAVADRGRHFGAARFRAEMAEVVAAIPER